MDEIAAINEICAALSLLCSAFLSFFARFKRLSKNPDILVHLSEIFTRSCDQMFLVREKCKIDHFKTSSIYRSLLIQRVSSLQFFILDSESQLEDNPQNNSTWLFRFRTSSTANEWLLRLKANAENAEQDINQIMTYIENMQELESLKISTNDTKNGLNRSFTISNKHTYRFQPLFDAQLNSFQDALTLRILATLNIRNLQTSTHEKLLKGDIWSEYACQRSYTNDTNHIFGVTVVGMAEFGKIFALRSFLRDDDTRGMFGDSNHNSALGVDNRSTKNFEQLCFMSGHSDGFQLSWRMISAILFKSAILKAKRCFNGKFILFIFGDVWETGHAHFIFSNGLECNLENHCHSYMELTTKYAILAKICKFLGVWKRNEVIFRQIRPHLSSIGRDKQSTGISGARHQGFISRLIHCYNGLPNALAVAGRAIAKVFDGHMKLGEIMRDCITTLHRRAELLSHDQPKACEDKPVEIGPKLFNGQLRKNISTIPCLQSCFMQVSEICNTLTILEKQGWVSVTGLDQFWKAEEVEGICVLKSSGCYSLGQHANQFLNVATTSDITLHDLKLHFLNEKYKSYEMSGELHPEYKETWLQQSELKHYCDGIQRMLNLFRSAQDEEQCLQFV